MTITHLNPESLHTNPAFAQGTVTEAGSRTIYVGGQNGVDSEGRVVSDQLGTQTEQALTNMLHVLEAAGASQEHVAKMTIHIVAGAEIREAFAASQKVWGYHPTAITILIVAGLANPHYLVEIDAIAAAPHVSA